MNPKPMGPSPPGTVFARAQSAEPVAASFGQIFAETLELEPQRDWRVRCLANMGSRPITTLPVLEAERLTLEPQKEWRVRCLANMGKRPVALFPVLEAECYLPESSPFRAQGRTNCPARLSELPLPDLGEEVLLNGKRLRFPPCSSKKAEGGARLS